MSEATPQTAGVAQTDPETDQAPSAAPTEYAVPGRFGGPSTWGRS